MGTADNDYAGLIFRSAVRSAKGQWHDTNEDRGYTYEDAAYASARLLAVADGTGGDEAGGEIASAAAIDVFRQLDTQIPAGQLLETLDHAVRRAGRSIRDMANRDPAHQGIGTTLTAIVLSGSELGLAHIGDTRAYMLRNDEFLQLSRDHTHLQLMLDVGKVTLEYIASHPRIRQSVLLRLLVATSDDYDADIQLCDVHTGDRYLLCSGGLHEFVDDDAIAGVLRAETDPEVAASNLVRLAFSAGGSDDVTCIVADVVPHRAPGPGCSRLNIQDQVVTALELRSLASEALSHHVLISAGSPVSPRCTVGGRARTRRPTFRLARAILGAGR
jgi:PPM family protein phosphatase